jgi:hypothetical protein
LRSISRQLGFSLSSESESKGGAIVFLPKKLNKISRYRCRQAPAHGRKSVLVIKKRVVIKDYLKPCLFAMQIYREKKAQGSRRRAQGLKEVASNQYPGDYRTDSITPDS